MAVGSSLPSIHQIRESVPIDGGTPSENSVESTESIQANLSRKTFSVGNQMLFKTLKA